MENFRESFSNFMWQRFDPELVKNQEHKMMLDNINPNSESERITIVDYGSVIAEVTYKAGLKDGIRLAMELGVTANE